MTLEKLNESMEALKALGEDPLKVYMRKKGFDPDKGCKLVLPESTREMFEPWGPPTFVHLSDLVTAPLMYRPPALWVQP